LDQRIGWAPDTFAASIQHVCVDHGRSHIGVAQQVLRRASVVTVFKQVRRERTPQRMTARRFGHPGFERASFIAFCMTDSWR
jgi:hypothetical protein